MGNERRWLISIFVLYFILAAGYSLLMPIWEAPDEGAHYHLAWYLAYKGQYAPPEMNYEAGQARGFYYVGSLVLRAVNTIDSDLTWYRFPPEHKYNLRVTEPRFEWSDENYFFFWGAYMLRWLNILFGGLALWLNWKAFKQISPAQPALCLAGLAFAALTPQYLHIMAAVNNDALGTVGGALLFYLAVRFLREPSVWISLLLIVLALLVPLLTKLTVLPISAAVLLIVILKWLFDLPQKRWLLVSGLSILAGGLLVYFLFPEVLASAVSEIKWRLFSLRDNALTEEYLRKITSQLLWTYWGKVGWIAVGLPLWVVQFLTGFGLIGMLLSLYKWIRSSRDRLQFSLWLATTLIAFFTLLAVFRNGLTTFGAQGRLLFPAIGALSLLMLAGWYDAAPERLKPYFPAFVIWFFLMCNITLWLTGVIPIYYQPFFD